MRRRAHDASVTLRPGRAAAPGGSRSLRRRRRRQHHDMAAGTVGRSLAPAGVPLVAHGPPATRRHRTPARASARRSDRSIASCTQRCDVVIAASHVARRRADRRARPRPGTGPRRRAGLRSARPCPRRPDMRRGRRIAVLCVANWLPNKGIHELLDAVRAPAATTPSRCTSPDATTSIAATPAGSAASSRTAGSPRRVVVHGPVDRSTVAGLYAGADVFALPTRVETYGTAVAEALRAGLPTVGWRTRQPAQPDHRRRRRPPAAARRRRRAQSTAHRPARRRRRLAGAAGVGRTRGAVRTLPTWAEAAAAFFGALRRHCPDAVEPAHDGTARLDVDAADAGVLDVQPPGHADGHVERPGQRRLDRADVADDDHH